MQHSNNETPADSALPLAWQHRGPSDAEIHRDWAERTLDDLPCSGLGCETVADQLAAAQCHALLSLAARLEELINAIRAGAEGSRSELEGIRREGIATEVSGSVWVTS